MLMPEAELLHRLKSDRGQRQAKLPLQRSLFVRIHVLVQEYGLKEDFLRKIDEFSDHFPWEPLQYDRIPVKENLKLPLFSLATPEKYRLTLAIMEKVNNPYLNFAHSPDEILVCNSLFRRNPAMEPELLAGYHFRTLLLCESAREEVQMITRQQGEGAGRRSLQERLDQLQKFLTRVENLGRHRVDSHV